MSAFHSSMSARRALSLVIVLGLSVAACSSDDSSSPPTTSPTTNAPTTEGEPATTVEESSETTSAPELTGEGLAVGLLVPGPGLLTTLFQAQQRGIGFAAADIEGGGGVLGGSLNVTESETPLGGTENDIVDAAVEGGARALIGPAGSTSAIALLPELARLNTVACTASATVPQLTAEAQENLFRTALPDDVLVGYMADQVQARRDADAPGAAWKITIVAREDDYGYSVGNGLAASLEARGFAPTVVGYNPRRVSFADTAAEVAATQANYTVLVTYDEGPLLLSSLISAGLNPSTMLGLDAFFAPRVGSLAGGNDPASIDGFNVLGTVGDRAFIQRLIDDDPEGQVSFAAQAYDCAVVLALAAEEVESAKASTIASAVRTVTAGGRTCTTYDDCLAKLAAGEDIDYDGVSGRLAIDENGDPTFARFATGRIQGGELIGVASTDIDFAEIGRQEEAFAAAAFNTRLQQSLRFLGFYDGPIDGLDSPELTAALAAFQASVGLPATGIYDEATAAALVAALGEYGNLLTETTKGLQDLLRELGYYDGPSDGIWTAELTEAVKALQRDLGVPETGVPDAATLQAAFERGIIVGGTTTTTVPAATTTVPTTVPATTAPPVTTEPPTTPPPATAPPETAPPETAPPETVPETTVPEETFESLFRTLAADPNYSIFVELLLAAGFNADTGGTGIYTVFAPTNDALNALPAGRLDELKADPAALSQILAYHIVEGSLPVASITADLVSINGATLPVDVSGSPITIAGAPIVAPDIQASNGFIQGIGTVLTTPIIPT